MINKFRCRRWHAARVVAMAGLLAVALAAAGCQGLPVLFGSDPTAEAEYALTKDRLLVLVEQYSNVGGDPLTRYHLQRSLAEQLNKNNVNRQVVPDRDIRLLQSNNPMTAQWSAAQLGREMNAAQVLHVQIEPYIENSEMIDPTSQLNLAASVRVIDAATGDQLWPVESKGRQVVFRMRASDLHGSDLNADARKGLAVGLADRVAKLFYKHELRGNESGRRNAEAMWSR